MSFTRVFEHKHHYYGQTFRVTKSHDTRNKIYWVSRRLFSSLMIGRWLTNI